MGFCIRLSRPSPAEIRTIRMRLVTSVGASPCWRRSSAAAKPEPIKPPGEPPEPTASPPGAGCLGRPPARVRHPLRCPGDDHRLLPGPHRAERLRFPRHPLVRFHRHVRSQGHPPRLPGRGPPPPPNRSKPGDPPVGRRLLAPHATSGHRAQHRRQPRILGPQHRGSGREVLDRSVPATGASGRVNPRPGRQR